MAHGVEAECAVHVRDTLDMKSYKNLSRRKNTPAACTDCNISGISCGLSSTHLQWRNYSTSGLRTLAIIEIQLGIVVQPVCAALQRTLIIVLIDCCITVLRSVRSLLAADESLGVAGTSSCTQ